MLADIDHPPGLPRWFSRLVHIFAVRRCNRKGHSGTGMCGHCGQILNMELIKASGVTVIT